MEKLLAYLNSLPMETRDDFADRCRTTVGYLRKAVSINQKLGLKLCIALQNESGSKVKVEDLRPDIDWAYIRGTEGAPAAASAQEVA